MQLLAKTTQNGQHKTLLDHTKDVLQVFRVLFGTAAMPTSLAERWRRFFKLTENEWIVFHACLVPAIVFHDLGKANSGFQKAVATDDRDAQLIRHEHLSALILFEPTLWQWLNGIPNCKPEIVVSAILGHHLKAAPGSIGDSSNPNRNAFTFYVEGLQQLLALAEVECLTAGPMPPLSNGLVDKTWSYAGSGADEFSSKRHKLQAFLRRLKRSLEQCESLKRINIAARAALIIADSAASGLTREGKHLIPWLQEAFNDRNRIDRDYIENHVIRPRIRHIESSGKAFKWRAFQDATAKLPPRALLLSSCGSGKTLAAWRWIQAQAASSTGRVIFLYPTRATATEGFRDYVAWGPETDVSLMHGTAAWELKELSENPETRFEKDYATEARLFAIGFWHRRVFSATVDQFLGFMQHSYGSICLLPLLVDSVIVMDEVHSFDKSLFSALKKFLRQFDVPVLCMTASLPQRRQADLQKCGLEIFPRDLSDYPDLEKLAGIRRYFTRRLTGARDAEEIVRTAMRKRQKVLWVVNTVARCQEVAKRLGGLCYHSGYTLEDRKKRHDEVIHAFQRRPGPLLAVTTQVCEMSLDLDADVLVTEESPITSLIQRMGRCNRHATSESERVGEVFAYPPDNSLPYDDRDLAGVEKFLSAIDGRYISQLDLQELLDQYGPDQVDPEKYTAFLESGPFAIAREESLRDENNRHVQAILSSAIDEFLQKRHARQPVDGYLLPAPQRLAKRDTRLGAFPYVVNHERYSSQFGLLGTTLEAAS